VANSQQQGFHSPIILALDTKEIEQAAQWIEGTRDYVDIYKIGFYFWYFYFYVFARSHNQGGPC